MVENGMRLSCLFVPLIHWIHLSIEEREDSVDDCNKKCSAQGTSFLPCLMGCVRRKPVNKPDQFGPVVDPFSGGSPASLMLHSTLPGKIQTYVFKGAGSTRFNLV